VDTPIQLEVEHGYCWLRHDHCDLRHLERVGRAGGPSRVATGTCASYLWLGTVETYGTVEEDSIDVVGQAI
jgi:hypothetical protein